ncbi:helix-turn-helix domain-containing protein [Streptomyces cavernicola]|uniref:Helix-turn-helix transcriptional regulator n=1 Tax=Streptomyces cavernicola TaxID=3043613 RepID=A0ABT6SJK2_9ACTN|nr:helix-turn-helix transcriptional regulator [Streptomyces sp. B-S-A6]MDI3408373.1 helix-turn-helix transcriptional regulator [Streptomyces sp. B-S-A6]
MSTDFQQAREALGERMRELRYSTTEGRLTGTQLAQRLGWAHSKVYKLENGQQTATIEDLRAWADAVQQPHAFQELASRLRGFESHIRSWRRQLAAGHRPAQDSWNAEVSRSTSIYAWEGSVIPGMLQTADYARHVFLKYAKQHGTTPDTEEAVHARLERQAWLRTPGNRLHVLVWQPALHALVCPPSVLKGQLDRLMAVIGLDTVELGVVPLAAPLDLPPANGFWVFDARLVITEDEHAELWLDNADSVATYLKVWRTMRKSAVFGAEAQKVISAVSRSIPS